MSESTRSIEKQIILLRQEREEDYLQYQQKILHSSLEERIDDGVTWYPVNHVRDFISTGERITVVIKRTSHLDKKHAFQVGAVAGIFTGLKDEARFIQGVISMLKDDTMHVVLNQSSLPDWVYEENIGVNLLFDDNTYKEMGRALKLVLNARQNRLAELRDIFYGDQLPSFETGYDYDIPGLNEVQNEAFRKVTHASDIALIHGPPGTGKTTTLVKCIKEAVRVEKQVLACAASNAAVDLLVEKLVNEGLNVLRLGHPARLTPEVIENSLDVKISQHVDFKRLRGLRQRSEEFRKLAKKYKRQYGKSERIQRMRLFYEAKALKAESRNLHVY
jgi:hypothetical protein